MKGLDPRYRMAQKDIDSLTRAREALDAAYDTLMQVNLTVKAIVIKELRTAHTAVWELEQKAARVKLHWMARHGLVKNEDLPEWARLPSPPPEPAADAPSKTEG